MALISAADAVWHGDTGERRAALTRMRSLATGLLVLMLAAFAGCSVYEAQLPWLAYPRAFAEAAMIGACADWFAVVALFRHPLGLPVPHTAILTRHKQRIADTIGVFFSGSFFDYPEISERLDSIDIARRLADWLCDRENAGLLVRWSRELLPPLLDLFARSPVRDATRDLIRRGIDAIAAAPLAGRVLAVMVAQNQHDAVFDLAIDGATRFLGNNRAMLRDKITEHASKWRPRWVNAKLGDMYLDGLLKVLAAARAPDHSWRREYRRFLDGLIERLAHDPETYAWCERVKSDVLDSKLVNDYLAWLVGEAEAHLKAEAERGTARLAEVIEGAMPALGEWIGNDERVRDSINQWARQLVLNTVVRHRDEIGAYVAGVVARWNNETFVKRVELQVGKDLQFIRINGTIVGGTIGLILFAVTKLFG